MPGTSLYRGSTVIALILPIIARVADFFISKICHSVDEATTEPLGKLYGFDDMFSGEYSYSGYSVRWMSGIV